MFEPPDNRVSLQSLLIPLPKGSQLATTATSWKFLSEYLIKGCNLYIEFEKSI